MRHFTPRHGGLSGAALAFLVSVAVLGGLLALMLWEPRHDHDRVSLRVYCAAGLKKPFEEAARKYEEVYGVTVEPVYAGSESLIASMILAEDGDLYIPADASYIDMSRKKNLLDEDLPLASMHPVVAVAPGNPKKIASLDDLMRDDVTVSQGLADATAVGGLTRSALKKAGKWDALEKKTRVFKPTVNDVANDVRTGGVDAGIVWNATVAQANGKLEAVELPELKDARSTVTVGVLKTCRNPPAALRFARFLTARDQGCQAFARHGFDPVADADLWADGEPKFNLFAGAMLRPAIQETLREFARREGFPEENIQVVYDGCGSLVAQMKTGQHPDAYFACDSTFLDMVNDLFIDGVTVSTNQLVILVHKGNPHHIASLRDLSKKGLRVGVGHEKQCAMGALTQETLKQSNVQDRVMKNVVTRVPTGDMLVNEMLAAPSSLDAVIAYISNGAKASDRLDAIQIDIPCAIATQPIAVGKESNHKHLMARLVRAIRSAESRARFEEYGFKWLQPAR
jgi:molybdenum ABC transporter molybdate-binding protein